MTFLFGLPSVNVNHVKIGKFHSESGGVLRANGKCKECSDRFGIYGKVVGDGRFSVYFFFFLSRNRTVNGSKLGKVVGDR